MVDKPKLRKIPECADCDEYGKGCFMDSCDYIGDISHNKAIDAYDAWLKSVLPKEKYSTGMDKKSYNQGWNDCRAIIAKLTEGKWK